jgi:large subunit ribosomal protein L4
MIDIPVYNTEGENTDAVSLDEAALGGRVKWQLLRQAVLTYESNQRVGTAKTKTYSEVTGSNRKPWPQKGVGRARHGSRQSPIWVGGGVTFGPQPRDYSKKLNQKARRRALLSAVLGKMQDDEAMVVDELRPEPPKTRVMARVLDNLGVDDSFLIVVPEPDETMWRCVKNIPGSAVDAVEDLNAHQVLQQRYLMFTREGLDAFREKRCLAAGETETTESAQE